MSNRVNEEVVEGAPCARYPSSWPCRRRSKQYRRNAYFTFQPYIQGKLFLFKKLKSLLDKKQSISICIAQTNPKALSGFRSVLDPKPFSCLRCVSALKRLSGVQCVSTQLRSSHDRLFASCKRNLSYDGASYFPLQVELRSLRDRSFASRK
jgi:hypothetical protein